jgi:LPXTG-motif cell wall-anchored protein
LTARDIALATVVVANAVPTLPNTGISPDISILWGVMIPTGIFAALGGFYIGRKKRLI